MIVTIDADGKDIESTTGVRQRQDLRQLKQFLAEAEADVVEAVEKRDTLVAEINEVNNLVILRER